MYILLEKTIQANVMELINAAGGSIGEVQTPLALAGTINFRYTDMGTNLHIGIGKGDVVGVAIVNYRVVDPTTIEVNNVDVQCSTQDDVYDWAYGGKGIGFVVEPKHPATVQAGHATLPGAEAPDAGRVFLVAIETDETVDFGFRMFGY